MGEIEVPTDRYWGAQTQRSLVHFSIGDDRMPKRVYRAYGYVKKAAALVNAAAGRLPQWNADAVLRAADEAIGSKLDEHFPLYVADRIRHAVEYEHQRSAVELRDPTARRQDWQQVSGAPER